MPDTPFEHAATIFTAHEMLQAYLAERIERLADRMGQLGMNRLAIFGSREHSAWLQTHIGGIGQLPIVAFIDRPDRRDEPRDIGVPVVQIDDPSLAGAIDAVLISDDRCEQALGELAMRHLPPGTIIHTLYGRMPIGDQPLDRVALAEVKPRPRPTSFADRMSLLTVRAQAVAESA